jgi:hypothetical protein
LISGALFFAPSGAQAVFPEDIKDHDFTVVTEDVAIGSFHADIEVHEDRSVRVTETIHAVFKEERHGIFRDIPIKFIVLVVEQNHIFHDIGDCIGLYSIHIYIWISNFKMY